MSDSVISICSLFFKRIGLKITHTFLSFFIPHGIIPFLNIENRVSNLAFWLKENEYWWMLIIFNLSLYLSLTSLTSLTSFRKLSYFMLSTNPCLFLIRYYFLFLIFYLTWSWVDIFTLFREKITPNPIVAWYVLIEKKL